MKRDSPDFSALLGRCRVEIERGAPRSAALQLVCDLLHREVPHFDWFGFYLTVPEERMLVLGPFAGTPTDHVRIPYGRGICGQAAEREQTFRIDDVHSQDNYLACSLAVKSEIVVPVFDGLGTVIAEIDIDSHRPAAFTHEDEQFLTALAKLVAPHVPRIPGPDQAPGRGASTGAGAGQGASAGRKQKS